MKVVILAGGLPSTLLDEDEKVPKPMAEIGGRPILWHIMKQYSHYGYNDFIICTGYKGDMIKDYFSNYYIYQSDVTIDLSTNHITIHKKETENWKVSVIDTGLNSPVSERIHKVKDYLEGEKFFVTYGDCVSDIHIAKLAAAHEKEGKTAALAVARPTGRSTIFPLAADGNIDFENRDTHMNLAWVNACNMALDSGIFDYFSKEDVFMGDKMLKALAEDGQICIYQHNGFWHPMETVRDRTLLENMWNEKRALWKIWND